MTQQQTPSTELPMNERLLAWLREACNLVEYGLGKLPDAAHERIRLNVEAGTTSIVLRVEFEPQPVLLVHAHTHGSEIELFRAGFEAPTH